MLSKEGAVEKEQGRKSGRNKGKLVSGKATISRKQSMIICVATQ